MKFLFKVFLICVLLTGCSTDDDTPICETGPVGLPFEVIDNATGENLFAVGLYKHNQIEILDKEGELVDFHFDSDRNIVRVLLGWETKSDVYTVSIDEAIYFDIIFTLERNTGGGCSSTSLVELELEGATAETSSSTGITKIFIDIEN